MSPTGPAQPPPGHPRWAVVAERVGPKGWSGCGPVEHWHLRRRRTRLYENRAGQFARPPVILYARASVESTLN
ncbi:hypothetical protein, partial [Streptomyces albidoflavus]|uniref:hypothetical protein n=1 Tax=Streptomyces albidoflavus TaxID=1886 RepID=UPI001C5476F1